MPRGHGTLGKKLMGTLSRSTNTKPGCKPLVPRRLHSSGAPKWEQGTDQSPAGRPGCLTTRWLPCGVEKGGGACRWQ